MNPSNSFKTTLLTSFLVLSVLGSHYATAEIIIRTGDACGNYAAKAVYQHRSQKAARCGFSGTRWNENGGGQHHWCRTVRPAITEGETKSRAMQVMRCLNPHGSINLNDLNLEVSTLNNLLRNAINRGATERAQQLIAAGANLTEKTAGLMNTALYSGNRKTIALLKRMGAPISVQGNNGLHHHIEHIYSGNQANQKKLATLEWLLQQGANPNHTNYNNTPLCYAISNQNDQAVALLLRYRANPNLDIKGKNCTTTMPLDLAIDRGNEKIIQLLRRSGAKSQAQCTR